MKQIAMLGDLHLSRRAENPTIRKWIKLGQYKFFEYVVKFLKEKNIDTILFTGDIFDPRVGVNTEALIEARRLFKNTFKDFKIHIIAGNHDFYYTNSSDITPLELFEDLPNVSLYLNKVSKIELLNKTWYMVPWILEENQDKFTQFLKKLSNNATNIKDTVIFGHFDTMGIEMEGKNTSLSTFGIDSNLFLNAAKLTISGHYHGKSITEKFDNTLLYLGSPFPLTFANLSLHGIWLLNEDLTYEFIENKISPNFKHIYDTEDLDNLPDLSNSFVKFFLSRKKSQEEILHCRLKVEGKNPLVLTPIPYKESEIDTISNEQHENATDVLHMDLLNLSNVYISAREDDLPKLSYYTDVKDQILKRIKQFDEQLK